ncbi:MAG: peptidase C1 [Ignavibacteria bacterium]|nr:peptidase C1 [Ignavibacteria bacterium]
MKKIFFSLLITLLFLNSLYSQDKNKGEFIDRFSPYYDQMLKEVNEFENPPKPQKKIFKLDFTGLNIPKGLSEFKYYWFNEPVSQGITGTCWSFCTTSFYESEIYRIHNRKIKLSEMWTVYWEYVEKAKGWVRMRGDMNFGEGSQSNAVKRIWKQYGVVPLEVYTGLLPNQKVHNHSKMFNEMNSYLETVKKNNQWNEEEVVETIKSILNYYMGTPPEKFIYEGEEYTPMEFLEEKVNLNLDDYIDVMSILEQPFYQQVEYTVPDNWWHNKDYYNIPVNEFMMLIKEAIRNGYTMAIGGDVSEAGYDSRSKAGIVPTFDIPSEYIDDYAREFRFDNKTTGDDHGIHLVGYTVKDGKDWYLIKDSGAGSRNVDPKGFYFYHEDYVKLKMLTLTIHKDAAKKILSKFK